MPDSTMLQSKDLQERYERYKAKIKNFTIMNDIFMRNVLKKKECTEYILQVIMEDKGITVIDQTLQKVIKTAGAFCHFRLCGKGCQQQTV